MRQGFKGFNLFNIAALAAAVAWGKPVRPNMEGLDSDLDPSIFNIMMGGHDYRTANSKKYAPTNSRYYPHQGLKECARRRAQMAKLAAK